MSILGDDRKVVDSGRKKRLDKSAKASLRDQVVVKLAKRLESDNIGSKIANLWLSGIANRAEWMERQQEYLDGWDNYTIGDTSGPFSGSSDLHLPTLFIVVKTIHSRFRQALLGVDPPFNVKARTEAMVDKTQLITDTMRYAIKDWANYNAGIEEAIDKWIWSWISTGSGVLKWGWDCTYSRFVDVQEVEEPDVPEISVDEEGKEVLIPKTKMVEKEVEVTKKTFEGPTCSNVRVEDLLIIGGEGDPDRADAVIQQSYMDSSQLWTLVDRGIFNEDAVSEVIGSGPDMEVTQDQSGMKQARAENSGQAAPDNQNDHDRYQVLEAYIKYDADQSGLFSDVIVWVHPRTRRILRATYLYRTNKAGERPFKKIDYHVRDGQEYGVGIVEILYPLAKELDFHHNLRIDFGMISVLPFGFYRPSSSINPETINLEPGALIPVDNPQTDVFFPNLGNRTTFGMQEEQAIQQMIDRVTSISDLNLGVISGQGATRTATGTKALVGESNANLDVYLSRLNRGWKRSLEYLLHMLQQRIPRGLSFRVTGESGDDYWHHMKSAKDLEGDYDLEVSENSAQSNIQVRQDVAQQILQATSNPLDIQLGLVNANSRYAALKNYYQSLGIKDWGRYVQKPQGYALNLTPEEEANRLLRHGVLQVTPNMDHDGFIAWFEQALATDEILGHFTEEETILLARQAAAHEAMKQALAAAAAQAANSQQMQINQQMGTQQPEQAQAPAPAGTQQGPPSA